MKNIVRIGILSGVLAFSSCSDQKKGNLITTTGSSGQDTTINVNDILFTVPTIENAFPDFENKTDSSSLQIPEDDWRQIEFISKDQKSSIDTEIDSINYIFEHKIHKGPHYVSFKEIRVRRLIKQPLSIPIGRILNYLGDGEIKQSGLNILNNSGQVKNGFSFICKGVEYYGIKDNSNNVTTFCISGAESDEDLYNSLKNISKFLKSEKLFLVHWTHTVVFDETNVQQLVADFESK